MNRAILTVVMTGVAAASFCMSSVTFAQAGGNGQGGIGAGNAHGAATAGMTYQGDPISSAWTTKPAGMMMNQNSMNTPPATPMSSSDGTHAQTDTQ
jgi:hypothetical protein